MISIKGAQPGSSFLLDTIYCVEYIPSNRSDVYSIAKNGPPANQRALDYVNQVANRMPIAASGSASSVNALDLATSIGKVIGIGTSIGSALL